MRQNGVRRRAKAKQASKLAEIRKALEFAGCDTVAKQAAVLGLHRSTTWALFNQDKRAGPSAIVLKRILSSPNLPRRARRKIDEYIEEKIGGLYGHSKRRTQAFRHAFQNGQKFQHSATNSQNKEAATRLLEGTF